METSIIKIGNSQGIRIPKLLLKQCGLQGEVQLEIRNHELVISSKHKARKNWNQAFKQMAEHSEDQLFQVATSDWDEKEWEWK